MFLKINLALPLLILQSQVCIAQTYWGGDKAPSVTQYNQQPQQYRQPQVAQQPQQQPQSTDWSGQRSQQQTYNQQPQYRQPQVAQQPQQQPQSTDWSGQRSQQQTYNHQQQQSYNPPQVQTGGTPSLSKQLGFLRDQGKAIEARGGLVPQNMTPQVPSTGQYNPENAPKVANVKQGFIDSFRIHKTTSEVFRDACSQAPGTCFEVMASLATLAAPGVAPVASRYQYVEVNSRLYIKATLNQKNGVIEVFKMHRITVTPI